MQYKTKYKSPDQKVHRDQWPKELEFGWETVKLNSLYFLNNLKITKLTSSIYLKVLGRKKNSSHTTINSDNLIK